MINAAEIVKITKQYKTPCYIYEKEKIIEQVKKLKNTLFPGAEIYYSMKANPLIGICKVIYDLGCGIETASGGEFVSLVKNGFDANRITFTSPGKTIEEIEAAIDLGVSLLNIESYEEAIIINEIAEKKNIVVKVIIRINQNNDLTKSKIKMTGVASQFGIDEDKLDSKFFSKLSLLRNIQLTGFQIYAGTQILNAEEIANNVENTILIAEKFSNEYGIQIQNLNFGGGFGIPYFSNEKEIDLEQLQVAMHKIFLNHKIFLSKTHCIFESGRFIMAGSGLFVTKILYKKESRNRLFYICDGGANFHSASAFLGRFIRNNYPISSIPMKKNDGEVTIVGPLCTPTDVIGQNVSLSRDLNPGDLILIEKSGAYGLTYSPITFLSHESPSEVLFSRDECKVLRQRGNFTQYLNLQEF